MASANLPCAMNTLARCDFTAKSSDCAKPLDCAKIDTSEKRNDFAAFIGLTIGQTSRIIGRRRLARHHAIPRPSCFDLRLIFWIAAARTLQWRLKSLPEARKARRAQAVKPAP